MPSPLSLLRKYGIRPRKRLGQCFLCDPNILEKIVRIAGVRDTDTVVEIGSGIGVLTAMIARMARRVVAVEVDRLLVEVLQNELGDFGNVEIVHTDVLQFDFSSVCTGPMPGGPKGEDQGHRECPLQPLEPDRAEAARIPRLPRPGRPDAPARGGREARGTPRHEGLRPPVRLRRPLHGAIRWKTRSPPAVFTPGPTWSPGSSGWTCGKSPSAGSTTWIFSGALCGPPSRSDERPS